MFDVDFYITKTGSCPMIDYLNTLDNKTKAKVMSNIQTLSLRGNQLKEPFTKSIDDGIFELRTITQNTNERSLFFFMKGKKIIMTNGFTKKVNKTPRKEIDKAKKYRDEFLSRGGNDA